MTTTDTIAEAAVGRKVTVERRNDAGELVDLVDLDPVIFGITPNVPLMHQVVTAQLAARRSGTHSTKTRSEVAGGGAKPYRQKGTGRARQGTIRAPQFTGGGVALGPKPRSYAQRTPRKMVRLALHSALSDRAAEGRVILIDEWSFEVPKTKDAIRSLRDLGLAGRVLLVIGPDDAVAERSFANLRHVRLVEGAQLTAYEVLASDWVLFTSETIPGGLTVSDESSPTVPSAAIAGLDTDDTSAASAPADETAAGADASAVEAAGVADAGDEDGADASAGEPAGAEAPAEETHADTDVNDLEPSAAALADAEARAHDSAVIASLEAAEAAAEASAVAAGSADETAVSPSRDAEAGAVTGSADEAANEDEEGGQ